MGARRWSLLYVWGSGRFSCCARGRAANRGGARLGQAVFERRRVSAHLRADCSARAGRVAHLAEHARANGPARSRATSPVGAIALDVKRPNCTAAPHVARTVGRPLAVADRPRSLVVRSACDWRVGERWFGARRVCAGHVKRRPAVGRSAGTRRSLGCLGAPTAVRIHDISRPRAGVGRKYVSGA